MNVIKVYGGLGNQMFQYAFGLALLDKGRHVVFDVSWYDSEERKKDEFPRPFGLDKFHVQHLVKGRLISSNPYVYENRIGKYEPGLLDLKTDCNFIGYWQYPMYFEHLIPQLRMEFTLKDTYITEEYAEFYQRITRSKSVSLHVRRGDYLKHPPGHYTSLPAAYYFDAISIAPKGNLYIFSDDLEWCKKIFKKEYFDRELFFVYMEDYLCLDLMRRCSHNIITNSTFSYWAALLNDNPDKVVICPRNYLDDPPEVSEIRYPRDWIRINDYATHLNR